MFKPVFLWWAHKELWQNVALICWDLKEGNDTFSIRNILSPFTVKKVARGQIYEKYGNLSVSKVFSITSGKIAASRFDSDCFACNAANESPLTGFSGCKTRLCPLDWSSRGKYLVESEYGCLNPSSSVELRGIYRIWVDFIKSRNFNEAEKYALLISELPLISYANIIYEIEEKPGQVI